MLELPRLNAPGHFGAETSGGSIAATTIAAAWNVQGRSESAPFQEEVRRSFGVELPRERNTASRSQLLSALWLGPQSWLLVSRSGDFGDFLSKRDAINTAGGALFDVSSARVAWTIAGPRSTDVLASGCPLDLHPRVFRAGACAQSVFGHVNVLIEKREDAPTFVLMVPRSFARDVEHALATAAALYGCDVLAPHAYS